MKRVFFSFLCIGAGIFGYGPEAQDSPVIFHDTLQEETFNPFRPKLPQRLESPPDTSSRPFLPKNTKFHLEVNIEGVVWGTDLPQAVIEGKIYTVGDILEKYNAKIIHIDKEGVSIKYNEEMYLVPLNKIRY